MTKIMNNYEINFFIWIVLFYVNLLICFIQQIRKLGGWTQMISMKIEKIANWSDEEWNALYIIFIKISSAVTSSDLMLE